MNFTPSLSTRPLQIALAWQGASPANGALLHRLGQIGHRITLIHVDTHRGEKCSQRFELQGGLQSYQVRLGRKASDEERRKVLGAALSGCDLVHALQNGHADPYWFAEFTHVVPTAVHVDSVAQAHDHPELWRAILARAVRVSFASRAELVQAADRWPLQASKSEIMPALEVVERSQGRRWEGAGPLRILVRTNPADSTGFRRLLAALQALPSQSVQVVCIGATAACEAPLADCGHRIPITCVARSDAATTASLARTCHLAAYLGDPDHHLDQSVEEALRLGLPVLTTGGVPSQERYGTASIEVVSQGDPSAWRTALHRYLEDARPLQEAFDALPVTMAGPEAAAERLDAFYRRAATSRVA